MPLQWQTVEVPLGASQDESQAPFALPQPLLASLKNARVYKTGAVGKRNGWAAQLNGTAFDRVLNVDDELFVLRQRTPGAIGAAIALGHLNANDSRVDLHAGANGSFALSEVEVLERHNIIRDATSGDGAGVLSSTSPDFAVSANTGVAVIAWESAVPTTPLAVAQHVIFAQAIDVNTRAPITQPIQISTATGNSSGPYVVMSNATLAVVVYARAANSELRVRAFDCSTLTWGADTVLVSDLNATQPKYDACEFSNGGTGWYVIYRDVTLTVRVRSVSGASSLTGTITMGEDANAGRGAVACYADFNSNNLWLAWYDATNGLRAAVKTAGSLTNVLSNTTMEAATDHARQITWGVGPGSAMVLCWTTDGVVTSGGTGYGRKLTKFRTLAPTGTKGSQLNFADVELISKAYSAPSGYTYAAVLYDGSDVDATVQGLRSVANQVAFTLQIVDTANAAAGTGTNAFRCAATWAQGEAGRKRLPSSLSSFRAVLANSDTEHWFVLGAEFDQVAIPSGGPGGAANQILGRPGVDLCRQRIDEIAPITAARIGGAVVFSGGVPQVWDGATLNEYGFLVPPENAIGADAGAGGALTAGAYGVQLAWEYRLATGDVVRSVPSTVQSAPGNTTITIAAANDKINVVVPALNLTRKWNETSAGQGVICRAYRTEANGTVYYRDGDFTVNSGFAASGPLAVDLTIPIIQADATAITHDKLYTTGDALVNFAPPALAYVHTHRNRLFGIVAENRRQVVFTHEYEVGELPGWHPTLVIDVPDDAVALATIDEKLVILARNGIFMVAGNGPDRKGLNNDYDQPFRMNTPHGCKSAASVASFPHGILYLADTGFCLMDRQTTVTRVGGPVEDTLAAFPYAHDAAVLHDREWVYWIVTDKPRLATSTDGRIVVYDWRHNVWSVDQVGFLGELGPAFTFPVSLATRGADVFGTVAADTHLYKHTGFADPGPQWIYTYVRTGMLHLGSTQRYQRARWLTVLGEKRGIHSLAVRVSTFHHATSVGLQQTFTWFDAQLTTMLDYSLKMHLANQTGAFFQVEIFDGPDVSFPTLYDDSASFNGLAIEMGLKRGTPQQKQGGMQ